MKIPIDRHAVLADWLVMDDNNRALTGGCNTPAIVMREYYGSRVEVAAEVAAGRFSVTNN